jgi:sulfur carrier protein
VNVTVNGDERVLPDGATVAALVEGLGAPGSGRGIAVALDGMVVPRGEWDTRELAEGARIEVVVAVQGG